MRSAVLAAMCASTMTRGRGTVIEGRGEERGVLWNQTTAAAPHAHADGMPVWRSICDAPNRLFFYFFFCFVEEDYPTFSYVASRSFYLWLISSLFCMRICRIMFIIKFDDFGFCCCCCRSFVCLVCFLCPYAVQCSRSLFGLLLLNAACWNDKTM